MTGPVELQECFVCHGQFDPLGMLIFKIRHLPRTFFACTTHDDQAVWAAGSKLQDPDRLPLEMLVRFDAEHERRIAGEANAMRQSAELTVGNGRAPVVHRGGRPPVGAEPYDPTAILKEAEREAAMERIADGLGVPLGLVEPVQREYISARELFERGLVSAADMQAAIDRVSWTMAATSDHFGTLSRLLAHAQDEDAIKSDLTIHIQ